SQPSSSIQPPLLHEALSTEIVGGVNVMDSHPRESPVPSSESINVTSGALAQHPPNPIPLPSHNNVPMASASPKDRPVTLAHMLMPLSSSNDTPDPTSSE
ncbi:hypothetical protein DXG01_007255, partial [Tephrocybe rancida]